MSSLSENKNRFSEVTTVIMYLLCQYSTFTSNISDLQDFAWSISRMFLKVPLTVFLLGVALRNGEYNCKDDLDTGLQENKLPILKGLDECIGHRYEKSDGKSHARNLESTCILTLVNLIFLVNKVW